jgi:hypothetical protein
MVLGLRTLSVEEPASTALPVAIKPPVARLNDQVGRR